MDASQKKQSTSAFASRIWSWLLGAWLLDFLVAGTPVEGVGDLVALVFAFFFLYTWSLTFSVNSPQLQELHAKRGNRIALSVVEALTILWSVAGWGALIVWFWMVDLEQVAGEAMQKAHEKIPLVFWLAVAVAVIIGGRLSFLTIRSAVKAEPFASDDPDIKSEKPSPAKD